MKLMSKGHFRTARAIMRANRWRSFLTMLGVIVGVFAVVLVVGIGEGIKQQVGYQINHYSKNVITVRPGQLNGQNDSSFNSLAGFSVPGSLNSKDVSQVAKARDVTTSVPLTAVAGPVTGDATFRNDLVIGTTADLPKVISQPLAYGVFFTADDYGNNVAVLGATAAEKMFDQDVPLGRSFTFRGQQFVVRGVLSSFAATPFADDANFNNAIFIPEDVAASLTNNTAPLYEILAKVNSEQNLPVAARSITNALRQSHGDQKDFSVLQPAQELTSTTSVLTLLTELIAGAAAISLLVGGIGIMNVMLVSVTERMHEIGIRKAVGATNRQILSQFVIEATALSVIGCVIGIILSFVADLVLRLTTSLTPAISWQIVLLAAVVSIVIGVVFGSVPALKAARKDPITALRNE